MFLQFASELTQGTEGIKKQLTTLGMPPKDILLLELTSTNLYNVCKTTRKTKGKNET